MIGDESAWHAAKPRILFLLKQPHDRNQVLEACHYDLTELFRHPDGFRQDRKTVRNRLKTWAFDIRSLCGTPVNAEGALRQAALMNLCKLPGGAATSDRVLREVVRNQTWFLTEQIRILDPHLVVCGGTMRCLRQSSFAFEPVGLNASIFRCDNRMWLDHHHPAAWRGMNKRHALLLETLTHYRTSFA